MVDPGEAEVLERIGGQLSERLALGVGRIEPAVADRLEQGAKGKRSRRGCIVWASHGVAFDSAREPIPKIVGRDCWPGSPFYDARLDAPDSRRVLLRAEHPWALRVASLLPRLSVHEASGSRARSAAARWTSGRSSRSSCPIFNEMYVVDRLIDAVCGDRLPAGQARDPGARRLDGRDARHRRAGGAAAGGARLRHQVSASRGPHGLQGGRARRGPQGRARRVHRDLRRRLRAAVGLPARAPCRYFADDEARAGAGALGPSQPRLLAAHARAGGAARRALRARARRRAIARAASSTSTARPACGAARRSTTPAAGSTTR